MNTPRSVIGLPIFGLNYYGRHKGQNFIMFYQQDNYIIMAVSKNPDRRERELKNKYGNKIKNIIIFHSFHGYEDKKALQKSLSKYRKGTSDCYILEPNILFEIIEQTNVSFKKNIRFIDSEI